MNDNIIEIGNKGLTLYLRVCFDALKNNNQIKIKAYGNNISKAIYISDVLKKKFDGVTVYAKTGTETNVSFFITHIICNENKIQEKINSKIINKCKKCKKEIETNEMYKDIDVYCKECQK